jgi:hypothetical protein
MSFADPDVRSYYIPWFAFLVSSSGISMCRAGRLISSAVCPLPQTLSRGVHHFICDASGPDYGLASLQKLLDWRDKFSIRYSDLDAIK